MPSFQRLSDKSQGQRNEEDIFGLCIATHQLRQLGRNRYAGLQYRMQMLGVRITGPVGSNPGRPMVCVTDPETKVTTCSPG